MGISSPSTLKGVVDKIVGGAVLGAAAASNAKKDNNNRIMLNTEKNDSILNKVVVDIMAAVRDGDPDIVTSAVTGVTKRLTIISMNASNYLYKLVRSAAPVEAEQKNPMYLAMLLQRVAGTQQDDTVHKELLNHSEFFNDLQLAYDDTENMAAEAKLAAQEAARIAAEEAERLAEEAESSEETETTATNTIPVGSGQSNAPISTQPIRPPGSNFRPTPSGIIGSDPTASNS